MDSKDVQLNEERAKRVKVEEEKVKLEEENKELRELLAPVREVLGEEGLQLPDENDAATVPRSPAESSLSTISSPGQLVSMISDTATPCTTPCRLRGCPALGYLKQDGTRHDFCCLTHRNLSNAGRTSKEPGAICGREVHSHGHHYNSDCVHCIVGMHLACSGRQQHWSCARLLFKDVSKYAHFRN